MTLRFEQRLALCAAASIALFGGCERRPPGPAPGAHLAGHNVLLVTLDTTRADRLGCYGYPAAVTPTLDELAAQGTLFQHAYAQAPETLPSHCTILTGKYPREHGVHNNGRGALGADCETLPSLFKEHGYRTGAFVASFVLDPRFGLKRGFDTYDADMGDAAPDADLWALERRADAVTDRALQWLGAAGTTPFFCWIHYYDPHDPYDPPPPFRERCADPYDGEIAFVDSQLRRVVDWLSAADLRSKTLIAIAGDHGEAFGEHGEHGHAVFLYDTTLHVPLIFVHPGVIPAGRQIATDVELADFSPTILDLMGWPALPGLSSRSLVPAFGTTLDLHNCFAESLYALDAYGWAEQRSISTPEWKYISSTRPELFDRRADPREEADVAPGHPDIVERLRGLLTEQYESLTPGQAGPVEQSATARRKLESLGYVGGGGGGQTEQFLTPGLPDPKDMLDVVAEVQTGRQMMRAARFADAVDQLQRAAQRSPGSRLIHCDLGLSLLEAGQVEAGIAELNTALRIDPRCAAALAGLGDAMMALRQFDKAAEYYRSALALEDQTAETHVRLGRALQNSGHLEEALAAYRGALARSPGYADAYAQIGALLLSQKQVPEAVRNLREAVRLNPKLGGALNNLGIALAQQGQIAEAKEAFLQATQIAGAAAEAYYSLGVTAGNAGQAEEAVAYYEKSLALDPAYMLTVQALASAYLTQHRMSDAIRVFRVAAAASPNDPQLASTLAWILATTPDERLRDGAQALEHARRAAELTHFQDPTALRTLAAALAETGDFAQAAETARLALELAEAGQQKELADALRAQLDLYRAGRPYRAPS